MAKLPFAAPKLSATAEIVKIVQWLKQPGERVTSGEPFVELETDKTILEIESPVDGVLTATYAEVGDELAAGAPLAEFAEESEGALASAADAAPAHAAAVAPSAPHRASPSAMRLAVARSVSASRRDIPSFWVERWIGTEHVHSHRERSRAMGERPTLTDYLVKAIARALVEHPSLRTRWVETTGSAPSVERIDAINVGVVVALDEGMVIPVLEDCEAASLQALSALRRHAVQAVRSGRQGTVGADATVSLSNLGAAGADRFEAIVQPGQSAIVAVGRESLRGSAGDAARGVSVVLSVDHRVIDGIEAARAIATMADWIENSVRDAG